MASIQQIYDIESLKIPNWLSPFFKIVKKKQVNWLSELRSAKHFDELSLQRVISYKVKEQLPNYDLVYYNKTITSTKDSNKKNKPDFLMWKKDYSEWYIIEVELENHGIHHVKEQISTFYDGDYSDIDVITNYVKKLENSIDEDSFKNMINSMRPQIMLIADHIQKDWIKELDLFSCKFSSLQIYSDSKENFIYRFNGEWPQEYSEYSFCTLDKRLRCLNVSKLDFFGNFNFISGQKIPIHYEGIIDEWEYLEDNKNESLVFDGSYFPLDTTNFRWRLIKNNKNEFHLLK